MTDEPILPHLLTACGSLRTLLDDPAVESSWDKESACPPFTVGGLVAHIQVGLAWFAKLLDGPRLHDPAVRLVPGEHYPTVVGQLADADNEAMVAHANARAGKGPDVICVRLNGDVSRLAGHAPTLDERDVLDLRPAWPFAMRVGDFASSRLCEVVIHADDVACSVGVTVTPDATVVDVLVDLLTRTARARHGDLAVIRALTRAERAEPVFPVY